MAKKRRKLSKKKIIDFIIVIILLIACLTVPSLLSKDRKEKTIKKETPLKLSSYINK